MTLDTGSVRSCKDSGIDVDTNAAVSRSDKTRVHPLPLFPNTISCSLRRRQPGHSSSSPFRRRGRRRRESGTAECILSSSILSLSVPIVPINKLNAFKTNLLSMTIVLNMHPRTLAESEHEREQRRRCESRAKEEAEREKRLVLQGRARITREHLRLAFLSGPCTGTQCLIVSFHNP